jgi:predicted flap endonuclease-1-like 5' DNA nuclease
MDFSNFFTNLGSVDSLVILILWVLAFLLGILLGSALRGGAIRRLRQELETRQNELTSSRGEVTRLTDELHLREADLRKTQFETEEQRSRADRVTEEKTKLYNEIYNLNNEVENLRKAAPVTTDNTIVNDLNTTIERLNGEMAALQNRNRELEEELAQLRATPVPLAVPDSEPQAQSFDYLADFQSTQNALRARLEALEGKLNHLATENENLRSEMQTLKPAAAASQPAVMEFNTVPTVTEVEPEPFWNLGNSGVPQPTLLQTDSIRRDDLTRIEGIGPFLERQLNDAGIYTYEQMSRWDGSDINTITQQIRYFPGRIEREDWVGQAIRLQQAQQSENAETTRSLDVYPSDHNDLTVIEGIDETLQRHLHEAGIQTWEELAEADLERLDAVIAAAGEAYRPQNPSTWAAQARLAAGGHWELLKEYQAQLKG